MLPVRPEMQKAGPSTRVTVPPVARATRRPGVVQGVGMVPDGLFRAAFSSTHIVTQ